MTARRSICMAGLLGVSLAACGDSLPRTDYDNFRSRSESERVAAEIIEGDSQLQDLSGRWIMHADLVGGIRLGLVTDFQVTGTVAEGEVPRTYTLQVWLHDQDVPVKPCMADGECGAGQTCGRFNVCESAPLLITTTEVADDGTFQIALPLNLPASVVNTADPVIADVVLNASTTDGDAYCGFATGNVTSPLTFVLDGSTFGATRYEPAQLLCQISATDDAPARPCETAEELAIGDNYDHVYRLRSNKCPEGTIDGPDGGMPDMGVAPDGGLQRPESPDLTAVNSEPRDLTGTYILTARVNGAIPLQLWVSLIHSQGEAAGSLDGALRSVMDMPGDDALETFSTTVDAEGRFEIWLPELVVATDLATVEANLLLGGATVEMGFCGRATGEVIAPPLGALNERTTFFATPWQPGTDVPEDAPSACP
ncbi:MAG: hypothetical protein ACI9U2_004379 [Bradymonadia bacterium]|jgi:hypothetical protein